MLTFCTGNKHKFSEVQRELGISLTQYANGYPELQADTLKEVVIAGMDHLDPIIETPYFLDDSGLEIEALDGFPGVYSAYVHKTIGNDGILRLLKKRIDRNALFKCVIGYRDEKGKRHLFTGTSPGVIGSSLMGERGFGFDPIFIPEGNIKTFAQMEQAEKNSLSHRGDAVRKFKSHLESNAERFG
mgnify:CR=1 FL=1